MKLITNQHHPYVFKFREVFNIEVKNLNTCHNSKDTFVGWNWFNNTGIFSTRKENKLPFICFERGAFPNTVCLDVNGFNYNSSSYDEVNWNVELSDTEISTVSEYINDFKSGGKDLERQNSDIVTADNLLDNLDTSKYKKIVFVPLQVSTDTVIKHFCGYIKTYGNFIDKIHTLAKQHKDILFLYKHHPIERKRNGSKFIIKDPIYDNMVCVDEYHFKACIDLCDSVMCINSGTGLAAMVYNKPVFLFGDAFYQFNDLNHKVTDETNFNDLLYEPPDVDFEKAQKFIYWLTNKFYSFVEWDFINPHDVYPTITKLNKVRLWTGSHSKTFK